MKPSLTFKQFIEEMAKYDEDFTVGYHEGPTEQDLKDLYADFIQSGKTFEEYAKEEDC